jgi:hypothetical protein
MLGGVVNAMSTDMSHKLNGHFNSLEAQFRPVEARVQQLKDEQAYMHAVSRHAESSRYSTYSESREYARAAHQHRIKDVYSIVPWSQIKETARLCRELPKSPLTPPKV